LFSLRSSGFSCFPKPPLGGLGDFGQVIQFGDHPKERGTKRSFRPLNFFHFFSPQKPASGVTPPWNAWNKKLCVRAPAIRAPRAKIRKPPRGFHRYAPRLWRHTSLSAFQFPLSCLFSIRITLNSQLSTLNFSPPPMPHTKKQNNIEPEPLRSTYSVQVRSAQLVQMLYDQQEHDNGVRPWMTATYIAEQLGVTARTVSEDIARLREDQGLPIKYVEKRKASASRKESLRFPPCLAPRAKAKACASPC
jgi:HTH domain